MLSSGSFLIFFGVIIYKHHWFAIILSIIPCSLLKIIAIILSFIENKDEKGGIGDLYIKRWYFVPLGIFSYLMLLGIKSLTIAGMKWFFDLKYVSHTTLLIIYGLIGLIFSIIFCVAATYIDCNKLFEKDIVSDICSFRYNNDDNIYYFDNFKIYFNNFPTLTFLPCIGAGAPAYNMETKLWTAHPQTSSKIKNTINSF